MYYTYNVEGFVGASWCFEKADVCIARKSIVSILRSEEVYFHATNAMLYVYSSFILSFEVSVRGKGFQRNARWVQDLALYHSAMTDEPLGKNYLKMSKTNHKDAQLPSHVC